MKRAYRPRPPLSRPVAAPAQLGSPRPRRPARVGRCAPLARSQRRAFMPVCTLDNAPADMHAPTPTLARRCAPLSARSLARSRRRAFMPVCTLGYARADMLAPTPPARSLRFGRGQIPARSRDGSLRAYPQRPYPRSLAHLATHPPRAGAAAVPCLRALRGSPRAPPRAEKRRPPSPLHCRRTPPTPPSQHQTGRKSRHTDEKPNPAARAARRDSREAGKQEGQEGELTRQQGSKKAGRAGRRAARHRV